MAGKRIQLENMTRDVIRIPTALDGEDFVLGDKADSDDNVPASGRDPKLQPHPTVVLTVAQYTKLGDFAHRIIDDQVSQSRIRRTELAA